MRICNTCGVPVHISKRIMWQDNGTISQRRNPEHRSVLIESETIDSIFKAIEKGIGGSVEHIVIESRRRSAYDYLEHVIPRILQKAARQSGFRLAVRRVLEIGKIFGYGHVELEAVSRQQSEGDRVTIRVKNPYSLPLFCGDIAATLEFFDGRHSSVSYERIEDDVYRITGFFADSHEDLEDRLALRKYANNHGNAGFRRCPKCGAPLELKRVAFDLEGGIITTIPFRVRLVGIGSAALEAVYSELESELGECIPRTIIDTQRRLVLAGSYPGIHIFNESDFRKELALRGFGYLREMRIGEKFIYARLENVCLHLLVVGLLQGFFEHTFCRESEVDWELAGKDHLTVEVTPRR